MMWKKDSIMKQIDLKQYTKVFIHDSSQQIFLYAPYFLVYVLQWCTEQLSWKGV